MTTAQTVITSEDIDICFLNRVHDAHGTCAGLDEDTLFERMMDAAS